MSSPIIIAIDGPAGSGKSTLGRALATRFGVRTLDTGACYRAVAAAVLAAGIDPADTAAVVALARDAELEIDGAVRIDGIDVSGKIRSDAVNAAVSVVAANQGVREVLVRWQRSWVEHHGGGVVEGRDIGTVVFPSATVKLFLTADPEERAKRRSDEGQASIERRDRIDSTRQASPLAVAPDAWVIDTTALSVEDVVALVVDHIEKVSEVER